MIFRTKSSELITSIGQMVWTITFIYTNIFQRQDLENTDIVGLPRDYESEPKKNVSDRWMDKNSKSLNEKLQIGYFM